MTLSIKQMSLFRGHFLNIIKNKIVFMKTKILVSTLVYVMFLSTIMAQPKIEFERTVHDFGEIVEGSIAKHEFVFTNTGNQPLVITSVRASCGCTAPTWTSEPVLPGQKGVIGAGYYSQGRPGVFNKSITVISNAETQHVQIFIKGEVKRDVATAYTPEQMNNSPKIALAQAIVTVGKVEKGQKIPINITVSNQGFDDLRIDGVRSPCNCIAWTRNAIPIIKNGNDQILQLVYSPTAIGEVKEEVIIYSNDLTNGQVKFEVVADVVENIDPQTILKQNNILKF
jgi:hypothetical protein